MQPELRLYVRQVLQEHFITGSNREELLPATEVGDSYHQLESMSLEETDEEQGMDKVLTKVNSKI